MTDIPLLLIEDDEGILTPLTLYLEQSGFSVVSCQNGGIAYTTFLEYRPSVVILDINLPEKNGIEICREIRSEYTTPIIILSARESEDDKVTLLELGADDYVAKPFSSRELVARIHAVLKRTETKKIQRGNTKILQFGKLTLDIKGHRAYTETEEIYLTKTEFSLLEYCIKNAKNIIKRDTLMKEIIGYDQYIYDRTIDTHLKNLRKKLTGIIEIETLRGIGYRVTYV